MRQQIKPGKQKHTQGELQQVIQRLGIANLAVPSDMFYWHRTLRFTLIINLLCTNHEYNSNTHIHTYNKNVYTSMGK